MKKNSWLLITAPFLLGVLACKAFQVSPPSSPAVIQTAIAQTQVAQPTSIPTLKPTPTPTAVLLYEDDFSDPLSGWQTEVDETDPNATFEYLDGEYHVSRLAGQEIVSWGIAHQDFDNAVLSVDTRHVSGESVGTSAAFFWRITPDLSSYYTLFISGAGQFNINKFSNNVATILHDWETSPAILRGQKVNHIDIYFADDVSIIYINNMRVAVFNDSTSLQGDIGLGAASTKTSGVDIAFDNLVIHSPDWVPPGP
jgi:hypothetical protein